MDKLEKLMKTFKEIQSSLADESLTDHEVVSRMRDILNSKPDAANALADKLIKSLKQMDGSATQVPGTPKKPLNSHPGWSQDPTTGSFHHKIHGVISPVKEKDGTYSVRAGSMGHIGNFKTAGEAGQKIKDHIEWLGNLKNPEGMHKPVTKNDDELHEKIAAKMKAEMDKRGIGGKQIADHYRDADESIPAAQRSNIKNSLKTQEAKAAAPKLKVLKEDPLDKSNYGPKGAGQYTPADNIKRKANNTGDAVGEGPNTNVKSYSSKPGQLSAKDQAAHQARIDQEKSAKNPVKTFSPEEIAEMNAKLHKSSDDVETQMANRLANIMPRPALQPSQQDFENAMLQSGIGYTQGQLDEMNKSHQSTISDFFAEAMKPIGSRFKSEEEELAYWNSIRVRETPPDMT